jgi:hypothetical protein
MSVAPAGSFREVGPGIRPRDRGAAARILPGRRRALKLALAMIWLLDAALQYQPHMFTKDFADQVIRTAAAGNPAAIADPITWSADVIARYPVACDAAFATIQLLLALGLLWRPTVKPALAASAVWAAGIWWIGEGLGGMLTGTVGPLTGAPGAALLYVFLALLAWPSDGAAARPGPAAAAGRLGAVVPRVLWAALWGSLGYTALLPANRAPGALSAALSDLAGGEPGWLRGLGSGLARALAGHGEQAAIVVAAACALAGATVAVGWLTRLGVATAVVVGAVIWLLEDFGEVFTGQGTDPNSGIVLIVIAAAFWPLPARRGSGRGLATGR